MELNTGVDAGAQTGAELAGADTGAQLPGTDVGLQTGAELAGADTGAQLPAADGTGGTGVDASAVAAAPATEVAKPLKKTQKCEAIFLEMVGQKKTRQEILAAFKAQADMTPDGAGTYYANLVKKHGISGEKSTRAAKPADTTAGTATSTTAGTTAGAAAGKATTPRKTTKPGSKTGGSTQVGATATFAAVTLTDGKVSAVQPMFSQLSATRVAAQCTDGSQVAVKGVPEIGAELASLEVLATTK